MSQISLPTRREMLLYGGKTFAAAVGVAALGGVGRANFLERLANMGYTDYGYVRDTEREAEEELAVTAAETCTLTCSQTLGPCYVASAALTRRDITSGVTGLPLRLSFRIVNADTCAPITNATVDVWHTNASGIYSASSSQVCTTGQNTTSQNYCRGVQSTDSDGRVFFDSVFPGWYSSRTTHIHFTIRINGTESVTSQFCFADRVDDFIYRKHPLYNTRSLRSTTNTNDTVFTSSNFKQYMFETRYKAGQMYAFKQIGISTSGSRC